MNFTPYALKHLPWKEGILSVVLVGIIIALSFMSKEFFTVQNLLRTTRYGAEIGLIALPMTMLIISRGIDLSVASNLALSAIVLGFSWSFGLNIWVAVLVALLAGSLGGLFNGFIITRLNIPPLVTTLATFALFRGVATGLSGGRGITGFPEEFLFFGQGSVGSIPVSLIVWVLGTLVVALLLHKTPFGLQVYAIGDNESAAYKAGIRTNRTKLLLYLLSGLMCALAATLYVARVGSAKSNAATGYELRVITAVVLGGTSLVGGEGTILGATLATLMLALLNNGLTLARIPSYAQDVIVGGLLVLAVLAYSRRWRFIRKGG